MTAQLNSSPPEETQDAPATETPQLATEQVDSPQEEPATPAASSHPATVSLRAGANANETYDDDYEDDYDDDYEDDYDEGGFEDAEDLYVDGPAEFVAREKGGRGRRIGSDVRVDEIDYKNITLLSRFLDRRGRILSRRKTRVSAKVQRRIQTAIKRARHLALLPYTGEQNRMLRKRR